MLYKLIIIGLLIYFFPNFSLYAVPAYLIFLFIRSIIRKENSDEPDPFLEYNVFDSWRTHDDK